jgi:hypothetical protein
MTQAAVTKTRTVITELAAPSLYAEAHCARGLWKVDQENQIQLFRGEVVENDSPGAGRSDHPDIEPFFSLEGAAELRKVLQLGKVECLGAQIAFVAIEDPDNQTTLSLVINGVEVLRPPSSQAAPDAKHYSDLPWSRGY